MLAYISCTGDQEIDKCSSVEADYNFVRHHLGAEMPSRSTLTIRLQAQIPEDVETLCVFSGFGVVLGLLSLASYCHSGVFSC